jgi:hypothetical protein
MKLRTPILVASIVAACLLVACDDDGGSALEALRQGEDGIFFNVNTANAAAHAAMVQPADLPGRGWEVTETDVSDDEDGSMDFMALASREPACSQITSLASLEGLGGIFGEDEDDAPVGWAQIELERQSSGAAFIPVSLEAEIEIERTVSDVQSGWQLAKGLLESDQTKNCIARVINTQFREEVAQSGLQMTFQPRPSSAPAPHDGATMAFTMSISLPGVVSFEANMEMHMWPYGNGGVSVLMLGPKDELTPALVADLLKAVDNKVIQAEKAN